jgi:putative PIN family toxin of toxin-antitoxin system
MMRVVLDTNVLVSALISPFGNEAQALDAVQKDRIIPCISPNILTEYTEVLARPKFGFAPDEIDGLIGLLKSKGLLFVPVSAAGTSPDPGDDDFIACALEAQAEFIVTGNKRHFPDERCGRAKVVSAREMVDKLNLDQSSPSI